MSFSHLGIQILVDGCGRLVEAFACLFPRPMTLVHVLKNVSMVNTLSATTVVAWWNDQADWLPNSTQETFRA